MSKMIELKDIHKQFAGKQVLKGVNLSVAKGESLVVIGGSGSGKSVMLKSILGLMKPERGTIFVNGIQTVGQRGGLSLAKREKINRQFGMLFQNGALFDSLTVWQNVAFAGIQAMGMAQEEARGIAQDSLRLVGLGAELLDLYPTALSGGMHKRVGLARAIAFKPEIIFFDEPTTGLDPIMTDVINHLIRDCVQELKATTLTITHDMSSVRAIADKTAFLYQGEIIWHGTQADMATSDDGYLHQFMNGAADGPIFVEGAD